MQFSDISTPSFYANPYPLYREIRGQGPLVNLAPKIWVTGRYDICDAVLRDRRMGRNYLAGIRARYGEEQARAPIFSSLGRMMLLINPPDHTRLRSLLAKAFGLAQSERFTQLSRTIAEDLVERFARNHSADLVRDYALPFPIEIICTLLDVPSDGAISFSETVGHLAQAFELAPMKAEQIAAANTAIRDLEEYFLPILHDRRKKPGEDLISSLLLPVNGDQLTEEEVLANIVLLFFAGHETTSNMIGNALIALHKNSDQLQRLMQDPALLPNALAECVRYDGSVQLAGRSALETIDIEGTKISEGDTVFLFLGAANRDPEKFQEPDRLLVDRSLRDARSLTFGGGLHHCLGARLAMTELEISIGTLFRRMPDMKISNLDSLEWHQRNSLRGVKSLHATWGA